MPHRGVFDVNMCDVNMCRDSGVDGRGLLVGLPGFDGRAPLARLWAMDGQMP